MKHSLEFARSLSTPFLVLDLSVVKQRFEELKAAMPTATVYYAVKANSHDKVLHALKSCGSHFDVASRFEIDNLLALHVGPDRISFGNPIKKEIDIKYAYTRGIRNFTTDSYSDVNKIARAAPGSMVMFRLLLSGRGADVPLSKKFGAEAALINDLIVHAAQVGLKPIGITFHVGSQQRNVAAWRAAITSAAAVFSTAATHGIKLSILNLGGGFPAQYLKPTPHVREYAKRINGYISKSFGEAVPHLLIEPGRFIVGDAGLLATEVVQISVKIKNNGIRWVYLDVGKFNGLMETLNEGIKYRLIFEKKDGASLSSRKSKVILAGPSCDSEDILYEKFQYELPNNLAEGDRIYFLSAGAYSASMSTIEFNGFPPLATYILPAVRSGVTVKSHGKNSYRKSRRVVV